MALQLSTHLPATTNKMLAVDERNVRQRTEQGPAVPTTERKKRQKSEQQTPKMEPKQKLQIEHLQRDFKRWERGAGGFRALKKKFGTGSRDIRSGILDLYNRIDLANKIFKSFEIGTALN